MENIAQNLSQNQSQRQRLSQNMVYGLSLLQMSSKELRDEIYRVVNLNPALEIVRDSAPKKDKALQNSDSFYGSDYSAMLEATEAHKETLQQHLMHQLNSMRLSGDEYDLSQKLIYNLDKTGCYGSMRAPETLIDKNRPLQNKAMLERCINRIQNMDPVGICCKNLEESLFVQAKIAGNAPKIALFLLDGHLDLLNPPEPEKVQKKLRDFVSDWQHKSFAKKVPLDGEKITLDAAKESIQFILQLNPHPASEFSWEASPAEFDLPDIVLTITKEKGLIPADDFASGRVHAPGNKDFHFQVKYASGIIPDVRLSESLNFDKSLVESARQFLSHIAFRQNTIVLQGCAIVKNQADFFEKGPGFIKPLTRRQIADFLGIHRSTVSRMAGKKNSKYFQTEFGLFPASYFFSSGVGTDGEASLGGEGRKISAEAIKSTISSLLTAPDGSAGKNPPEISDSRLTKILNDMGILIARRTVAKYRSQLGIENSYQRKKK